MSDKPVDKSCDKKREKKEGRRPEASPLDKGFFSAARPELRERRYYLLITFRVSEVPSV